MKSNNNDTMELKILKGAVQNTNEAFVTIDENSTVIFFNKASEKIFGYTSREVASKSLDVILSKECKAGHHHAIQRFLKTKQSILIGHDTEFTAMRKNGETFSASISFSISEIDGHMYFTGIIRDVSETKALQKQILQTARLAALGQTVAEISHEIKNPLVLIGGFVRQLLASAENETDQSKLQIISDEVKRLETLLAGLKDLYTIRNLAIKKINVSLLLQEIYALVKDDCDRKKIVLDLHIEGDNQWIKGDREKIEQVLLNIIKNGVEAMEDGGKLSINSQSSKDNVVIKITDNGPGIPEEIQKKILSPFFTTKKGGTGLGLCVSKRIVEDHPDSSFEIESVEGKGTSVSIDFPACS